MRQSVRWSEGLLGGKPQPEENGNDDDDAGEGLLRGICPKGWVSVLLPRVRTAWGFQEELVYIMHTAPTP